MTLKYRLACLADGTQQGGVRNPRLGPIEMLAADVFDAMLNLCGSFVSPGRTGNYLERDAIRDGDVWRKTRPVLVVRHETRPRCSETTVLRERARSCAVCILVRFLQASRDSQKQTFKKTPPLMPGEKAGKDSHMRTKVQGRILPNVASVNARYLDND